MVRNELSSDLSLAEAENASGNALAHPDSTNPTNPVTPW